MIVEDGTGLPNANAYISVEFADGYFSERNNTAWEALQNKEALIIRATDYLEAAYFDKWKGKPLKDDQSLAFPRDGEGVPEKIKKAVCELALKANSGELMADIERLTTREKVGSIEVEYAENADATTKYAYVLSLLSPFLKSASKMMVRAERC